MADYGGPFAKYFWDLLKPFFDGNEYATAGALGNLYAESNLLPYRLQGDFTANKAPSLQYTADLDNGVYTREQFMNDGKGFGIAQWTYPSRKAGMYDIWQYYGGANAMSIGGQNLNGIWFTTEMSRDMPGIYNSMKAATDIRTASNIMLYQYENPSGASELEESRYNLSVGFYNAYGSGTPIPPDPPTPTPTKKSKWIYYYMRRRI